MGYPVTLNGRTYTLADFEGQNYAAGFPDALEDFVTDAGAKVTAAASSATAAAASETAAAASAAAAAASVDAIEGFYLGAQASNPTVDLNGAAVTVGDFYFNTTTNQTRIYDGSSWNVIAPDLVGDASPQLGGTLDFNGNIATSFESTGIDDNATSTSITIDTNENVGIKQTNPTSVNGSTVVEASAPLGSEFIAGNTSTVISSGEFMGGYIFKNADSTGSPPHYAGMWAESEDTSGNMNLYLAGGNGRYESGTSDIFIEGSTGFVGFNEPAPEANLHIRNRTGVASSIRLERNDTVLATGNGIGQIQFAHQDSGNEGVAATLRVEAGDSSGSGDFVFQTGLAGTLGDRVRIDHDGHLHVYGGIVDLTDEEDPSLPVSIESTLTNGGGGTYDSSLKDSGQLQYNAASHLFADTSTVSSGFPQAWYEIDNGFRWGLGSTEYLTINSSGKMSLGSPASQGTHELSVRATDSPRISIDDTNGTSTNVNAGLLLRYDTTNAASFSYTNNADLAVTNNLAGDIVYETGAEHSFTIGGTEELRITNTETSVFGTSGDIFTLVDTNLTASGSNIGNVRIAFDDSAGTRVAYVGTANSSDFFVNNQYGSTKLTYAGSTKITTINEGINVTGSIGVNTTPDAGLTVHDSAGAVIATSNIARQTYTSVGQLQVSTAGSGGILIHTGSANYGYLTFGDGAVAGRVTYDHANNYMAFSTSGYERVRILDSGGITFNGDTAAANALDDYEEGTYTAKIFDAGSGGNQSSTTKTGYYTKVGRLVTVTIWAFNNINTSGMTSSAVVYVTLPFTAGSTGRYVGSVNAHGFTYTGSGSGYTNIVPKITQSLGRMNFASNGNGLADNTVKVSDITSGADDIVDLSITYHV